MLFGGAYVFHPCQYLTFAKHFNLGGQRIMNNEWRVCGQYAVNRANIYILTIHTIISMEQT